MLITELAINGLVQGSLLALICIGYSLAYGSAKVLNFAHADIMIAGGGYLVLLWIGGSSLPLACTLTMAGLFGTAAGITALTLSPHLPEQRAMARVTAVAIGSFVAGSIWLLAGRLSFFVAALLAVPCTAALATAVYRVGYLPLLRKEAPRTSVLLAALGFSIATESLLLIAWGSAPRVFPPERLPAALTIKPVSDGLGIWQAALQSGLLLITPQLSLPVLDAAIVVVFVLVAIAVSLFFRFSRSADAIVAAADSKLAARACGIPVERVLGQAFFLGGAIAAVGGTLYVLRAKSLEPTAGFTPGIIAFAACVLGGIGSLRGSIAGALFVGLVTSLAPALPLNAWAAAALPSTWLPWLPSLSLSDWSYGVVYVMMIVTILFKPEGLFAR